MDEYESVRHAKWGAHVTSLCSEATTEAPYGERRKSFVGQHFWARPRYQNTSAISNESIAGRSALNALFLGSSAA
jgi:hypothetical protein